jgi:hypothetical protein
MIGGVGRHRAAIAIASALVVTAGLGLGPSDGSPANPLLTASRAAVLASSASAADAALARLQDVVNAALDHARRGAAETLAGATPPAPELVAAADVLATGAEAADGASRAVQGLMGVAASVAPGSAVLPLSYGSPDLLSLAAGLRSSADAATLFVERRDATAAIVAALTDAVGALTDDQPAAALTDLEGTKAPLAILAAWTEAPSLLHYWMRVTGDLVDAARGIATATLAGDDAALRAAAAAYQKAGEAARGADNALAVTISEEAAAVSGSQLRRLAAIASAIADLRTVAQGLLRAGS